MLERTQQGIGCAVLALALLAGCQNGSSTVEDEPPTEPAATEEATPQGETEATDQQAKDQPVSTAEGAKETMRTIETDGESVKVTPFQHATMMLTWGDRVIHVDPLGSAYEAAGKDVASLPKADLVLVSDIHPDHLDPQAISAVRKEGAPIIAPQAVAQQVGDKLEVSNVLANGESTEVFGGEFTVEAVPMYNTKRKNEQGEFYHPKGRGNGYLLTMDGAKIYLSGDTECIDEMKQLEGVDAAFVSMNLPYTMPPEEAAECVREFKPSVLIPYHFRGQEPSKLTELLNDVPEVEVRVLDWYPEAEASK